MLIYIQARVKPANHVLWDKRLTQQPGIESQTNVDSLPHCHETNTKLQLSDILCVLYLLNYLANQVPQTVNRIWILCKRFQNVSSKEININCKLDTLLLKLKAKLNR